MRRHKEIDLIEIDDDGKEVEVTEEKSEKKKGKVDKGLRITGYIISAILIALSITFVFVMKYIDLFPMKYIYIAAGILILLAVETVITQRWRIPGIITKVVALLLIFVLSVGCVYMVYTRKTIKKITEIEYNIDVIALYVLEDSDIKSANDLKNKAVGKNKNYDVDSTKKVIEQAEEESTNNLKIVTADYTSFPTMFTDLVDKKIDAVICNSKYLSMYADLDEYEDLFDLEKHLRIITYIEVKTEAKAGTFVVNKEPTTRSEEVVDENIDDTYLNKDVICLYISGIDTYGTTASVSRSDVNILAIINRKTHQVLMINTPRDYYVPLSISDGMPDKLTHAGIYGIDVSIDTLAMLYNINIDYYLRVNFTGFAEIIDQLGGVTVYSDYAFTSENAGGYSYVAGDNYLDGEEALGFARERETLPGGDRERGRNQMRIIDAVLKKVMSPTILVNYMGILDAVANSMVTSMPYDVIGAIVKEQLNTMASWDIQSYSVDGLGDYKVTYSAPEELSVIVPDQETIRQAKSYIQDMYSNKTIKVEAPVAAY